MNRLAKCAFAGLAFLPGVVFAQSAQTIYKFVDESGRVTYANSPIKGGTKVNLEPLTVFQSPAPANNIAPAARSVPVAKVTSVPSLAQASAALPVQTSAAAFATMTPTLVSALPAPQPAMLASLETSDKSQERRADVRRRILRSEIQAEEKSLDGARAALAAEERRSGEIRTLRASFSSTEAAATTKKPLISPEARAEIEHHFERIRNLQDEIAMHEGTLVALREETVASK